MSGGVSITSQRASSTHTHTRDSLVSQISTQSRISNSPHVESSDEISPVKTVSVSSLRFQLSLSTEASSRAAFIYVLFWGWSKWRELAEHYITPSLLSPETLPSLSLPPSQSL